VIIVFTAYVGFNGPVPGPWVVEANRSLLVGLLDDSELTGYTLQLADGFYAGEQEPSATVTVICRTTEEAVAYGEALIGVCRLYKEIAGQAEVWITRREEELLIV